MRRNRCIGKRSVVPLNKCARHRKSEPCAALALCACKCLKQAGLMFGRHSCAIVIDINTEHTTRAIK
jgi:hypothetical protein